MLSCLSVSKSPVGRLRHWCSSRYLRISPLHREFRLPLLHSRTIVVNAAPELSPGISHPTYCPACAPFTPSNSGQRLPPTYYRGCWHVVSRGFLLRYRQGDYSPFFPEDKGLQSEDLLPSRGVAASEFPPLCNIPHCCSDAA